MPTISTLTAVLELDKSDFESKLDTAKRDLDGFGDRAQQTGEKLTAAGKSMTMGITAPLAAMGALSARTAANFDQAMQRSIAVMGDVDEAMREDLEERARQVANTTTHSANQAAESYYYLASAGLDAAQAMEAMPQVAAFAEAGNMRMAEATDVATNVMSAYNYEASEMSEVTDTLTATVTNHNQTMQDMSTAMSRVAPIASSLGVSIEETSAAIGQMGDVGIQGEQAGTALRNVLSQISDEASPVTKRLDEMGVQTRDAEGNVLSLTQILENMEEAGVEAGDAARIFGTEAGPAMAALISEGSDALERNAQRLREAEGASEDVAQTQRATLNAQMQMARSNIESVGIAIGSQLIPMLSTATRYVKGAAQQFQGLSDGQQKAIIAAAGVAAALGPVLMMAGLLAQSVVALSGAYGVLSGASLGLSGALSGALVPSTIAAQGGLTGMAAAAVGAQVALGPITVPLYALVAAIAALVAGVGAFAVAYQRNWKGVRDYTEWAIDPIVNGIDWFIEKIFGISDATGQVAGAFGDFLDWVIAKINKIPGIEIEGGDVDMGISMPDATTSGSVSEEMDTGDFEGEMPSEKDLQEQMPDTESMGQQAGQDFGSGFQNGLVEGIKPEEVESHLQEEIGQRQAEISGIKEEVERLERAKENGIISEEGERMLKFRRGEIEERRSEIEKFEKQLESARNAEDITDVDKDAVASVAQQDLKEEQERAEYIQSVWDDIEGAEAPETASGPSMSSEDIDEQSVEAMLAEDSSGSGDEDESDDSTVQSILEELKLLREDLTSLRLRVELEHNCREFEKIMEDTAEGVFEEEINSTGP
ncbi:phage tail tape measure protein [Natrinema sp. CGMCC1.2065]|uniref:phage tail tape measure protein n=1 Tax=Natrinema sp. CGMCC1.2065 TaxID=3445767 RepID=UPI003F49C440